MTRSPDGTPRFSSIVLAAGAGRRLASVTGGVPKQFWHPPGSPSLLDSTLTRLAPICPHERTFIVVNTAQRGFLPSPASERGRVVLQPDDRGTAAGLLFGLVEVLAVEPDAFVLVTPSDHGVMDTAEFARGIAHVISHVRERDSVVLLGVQPSAPQIDYGWILVDSGGDDAGVQRVVSFVEKPSLVTAERLLAAGALWNTMVIGARAWTLLDLCRAQLPDLTAVFVAALALPAGTRQAFLEERYPRLTRADFSRDVLATASNLLAYTWPASMGWSDLGTPDRLQQWLHAAAGSARTSVVPASGRHREPALVSS